MSETVISICGRKENWTPEDALAVASRASWSEVVVIGIDTGGDFVAFGSDATDRDLLYLAERLRLMAMAAE